MPEKAWTDPDTGFVADRALGATEVLAHDAHNRRVLALYGGVVVVSAAYVDSDHSVQYEAKGVTYYFCGRRLRGAGAFVNAPTPGRDPCTAEMKLLFPYKSGCPLLCTVQRAELVPRQEIAHTYGAAVVRGVAVAAAAASAVGMRAPRRPLRLLPSARYLA
jgi:YHS domain-containing protein